MTTQTEKGPICCPQFDPGPWDETIVEWKNKKFIRLRVFTIFYMPVNFGRVMKSLMATLQRSDAEMPDYLCLSDHTSKWNMDLYAAVNKEIPGAENVTISGRNFCRVYEGPFRDTGKWCKDYELVAKAKGFKIGRLRIWYTTCPKCAKKYGKNYVVLFGQIE